LMLRILHNAQVLGSQCHYGGRRHMWVVTTKLVGSPILVVVEHPSMNYEPMIIHIIHH
jgi:ABC-type branched-subunit amino acid transport system ATPase component